MDHMEYSIALPPYVEQTNAGAEWTTMKQRLFIHLSPNSAVFNHSPPNLSTSFLINISLEQVQEVFNMYGLSVEEGLRFNKILKSIEDLCLPRFLIIYNRYRFFTCKQNGPEFNGFLQQLLAWSDLCEFGDLKDILLKDCILSGISEESVRQHLLRTEQLDFDKTVEICKATWNKKHGTDNTKSRDNNYKDAWTVTESEEMENNNTILKPHMVDEVTNTSVRMREKETQTEAINTSDAGCEVIQEKDLINLNEIINDPVINDCIQNYPLFIGDGDHFESHHKDVVQIQADIEIPNQQQSDKREEIVTSINSEFILKTDTAKQIDASTNLRRSLRKRKVIEIDATEIVDKNHCVIEGTSCGVQSLENSEALLDDKPLHDRQNVHSNAKKATYKCQSCTKSFRDAASLETHKAIHSVNKREKVFKCPSCSSCFYTAAHLKVHLRHHTGERPYVCDTCGKGYAEAYKLKIHKRNHTGERPYKCTVCNMSFKWSAAFTRHKRIHTGERPFSCQTCKATFADLTSLQRHIRTHTKDRPYQCMCGSSFTDPSALRVHKRIHTGERPFSCSVCGASFVRSQHLKEHKKCHSGEKPHECEICHYKFSEASKLKSHMRRHTGERPYLCKICGRSFAWTTACNRHMRTHTLEKPYVCRVCGCAFADNSTLVRHRRTHTGERPYHCTHCPSTFADSSSLSRHSRIHTGEKAYTCDICGASFTVKSYLNRHLRIHSEEKSYKCDVCGTQFRDSSKLNRHKKIHAKGETKQEKIKPGHLLQTPVDPDLLPTNPELAQLQEHDIGQFLTRPFQFDPAQVRTDHDFEDIPVVSSVLDAILNIKS